MGSGLEALVGLEVAAVLGLEVLVGLEEAAVWGLALECHTAIVLVEEHTVYRHWFRCTRKLPYSMMAGCLLRNVAISLHNWPFR